MSDSRGRVSCLTLATLAAIVLLVPAGWIALRSRDGAAPEVRIVPATAAIGRNTLITIEATEPAWGIRSLRAVLIQEGREHPFAESSVPARPFWRVWGRTAEPAMELRAEVGPEKIPDLREGEAIIRVEATNDSPARFSRGRTTTTETMMQVLLEPPKVEVLSSGHLIRQAGSECVLYRTSDTAEISGVRVGEAFFRGYALPRDPDLHFALFAFPHDAPVETVPLLVARDAAGNEGTTTFGFRLVPRRFRSATLTVSDDFLRRVVPAILSETPSIESTGTLLEDFLAVNGPLRRENAAALVEMAGDSREEFLWNGPFTQLGGSQVMASFADHRTYRYEGRTVDRQTHLGFDLAVTANHPVDASNSGVVVHAGYFGIYGNTVVIDHGFGLQTLYSHLSSIDVEEGQSVAKGEVIGRSGATGLAGGDHLHFSVLIQGIPVDPTEWWDPAWIRNRIEAKLGPL